MESHVELEGLHQFGNQDTFQALTIWTMLEMMVILLHHHMERNPIPDSLTTGRNKKLLLFCNPHTL